MRTETTPLLILGAGVAGLSAAVTARRAGLESVLLEANAEPGGLCRSTEVLGCPFDYGPKVLLLDQSESAAEILGFLDGNHVEYPLVETVYLSKYGALSFPLQRHLIELPPDSRARALADIEAAHSSPRPVNSYEDWLLNKYGDYLCAEVLLPYEEKKWQIPLAELDYDWALNRPVNLDLDEVRVGAERRLPPNRNYHYPRTGSIAALTRAMAANAGELRLGHEITSVNLRDRRVVANGTAFTYERLVSSLPLNHLAAITEDLDDEQRAMARRLRGLNVRVFNLVFASESAPEEKVVYYPEREFVFRRVTDVGGLCPALARPGRVSISVEVSQNPAAPNASRDDQLAEVLRGLRAIPQLAQLGDPIGHGVLDIQFAYPMQVNGLGSILGELHGHYASHGVHNCGRGGSFAYLNADAAYEQGKKAVALATR